jgi:hypothetical protein
MQAQIDRAMRRPWRYWYEDGLAEMAMGAVFVALGVVFLLESWLAPGPILALVSMLGPVVAVLGASLLAQRAVRAVKARIVYPRTGYVAYRRDRSGSRLLRRFALGAGVGAVVGALAALPSLEVWVPAVIGLFVAGMLFYAGLRLDLSRFYLLAAASAVLGTLVSVGGLASLPGGAAYFAGFGLVSILSGAVTLCAYLRVAAPPSEAKGDDR